MSTAGTPSWSRGQLQARIDRSSFNVWLGLELLDWDAQGISLRLPSRPEMWGHGALNALHGGVLAALIDTGCSMAVVLQTGESVFTVDMRVDYLRPGTADVVTIRGEVVRLGRTLATADARILAPDGRLVACGRALLQHIELVTTGTRAPPD